LCDSDTFVLQERLGEQARLVVLELQALQEEMAHRADKVIQDKQGSLAGRANKAGMVQQVG